LKDTVEEGKTGFLFEAAEAATMQEAIRRALSTYTSPGKWGKFQRNGMAKDFSWSRSAAQYAALYQSLILP
jgi:starch synthase